MNKNLLFFIGAAALTYFYLSAGTTNEQSIPGLSQLYNIGWNFSNSGTFSTAA